MGASDSKTILIAGAGIAGLTAALAFAQRGFYVKVFERAGRLEEIGAGLQLSPNATRILDGLGVLPALRSAAVQPDAVVLRRAADLTEIARVPLGAAAAQRWEAPYLVIHRADLQAALLAAVSQHSSIELTAAATVCDFSLDASSAALIVEHHGKQTTETGRLVIGADGVWSTLRGLTGDVGKSRFIGQLAWRRTLDVEDPAARALATACPGATVNAFLHPGFHFIAYPLRGGRAVNLAAFTPYRKEIEAGWAHQPPVTILQRAMQDTSPALATLANGDDWTAWPIHVADLDGAWVEPRGLALIGDAAHAMTPFAAQGAAMAIEDAEALAKAIARSPDDLSGALNRWGIERRRRVLRVARRGALNAFAWHARGPVALARDTFLRWRSPEKLAADLDWLYSWKSEV